MNFNQFKNKLNGYGIKSQAYSYGHLIEEVDDTILVDGVSTNFNTLEEAREYIRCNNLSDTLEEEIAKDLYEEINGNKIASIIKEHHNIKVTDTIIESYLHLASSKVFTLDPVVEEIRSLNKLDNIIEGKLDFILGDGSIIAIDESTFNKINNILGNHSDIIDYMRESKQNFMRVIEQLEG